MVYTVKRVDFINKMVTLAQGETCVTLPILQPHEAVLLLFRPVTYSNGVLIEAA